VKDLTVVPNRCRNPIAALHRGTERYHLPNAGERGWGLFCRIASLGVLEKPLGIYRKPVAEQT